MVDEIKKNLQEIVAKIDGLYCITFTDRDGVPLLKVSINQKEGGFGLEESFYLVYCQEYFIHRRHTAALCAI